MATSSTQRCDSALVAGCASHWPTSWPATPTRGQCSYPAPTRPTAKWVRELLRRISSGNSLEMAAAHAPWTAMICAGVGWNFTHLAGTAFLVRSYATGRGSRLQAVVEGATGAVSVVASLLSATAFDALGWRMSSVLVLAVAGPLLVWQRRYGRRNATVADALDLSVASARPAAES
ncbi:hypothetical protein ACFYM5_35950 [Streptomyces sp. NPDC006706]|uniref:hypothetical protein n=1 Tax=Streptomyces sp. NPDC006706 TaxID=3364761 RepID=UPI0036CBBA23